jgi:formate-dependent nitrite reductase membrane component NrfD
VEEFITTQKMNPHIDPSLAIWGWEVPVYLFLGGLSAGILVLAAVSVLRKDRNAVTIQRLILAVPALLGLGMFALFLDLEHKFYVFRFYTAFIPTSPMSWGSWILLLTVPAMVVLMVATARSAWPGFVQRFDSRPALADLIRFAEQNKRGAAWVTLLLAISLGIYTGILLSAYGARPFWNSAILGPLFLASGLSAAAALAQLGSASVSEKHFYERLDLGLIAIELLLVGLFVINMMSGSLQAQRAADILLGGPMTVFFWVFVISLGLLLPMILEVLHLKSRAVPAILAPLLVIAGSLVFRFFVVEAGQLTTWISY